MDLFESDQFKSVIKEAIGESLQPLEEKIERRLGTLERIINDKADQDEEAFPVEQKIIATPSTIFCGETETTFLTLKHLNISTSFVVSPLSIILGWLPFYTKADPGTRKTLRHSIFMNEANQRNMEHYFFELFSSTFSSDITVLKRELNFSGKTLKHNFTISSYFSSQNRKNETIISDFFTSPTSKRDHEFITWEPNVYYYQDSKKLEIVKIRMEGNVLLHVFLPSEYYDAKTFWKKFISPDIHIQFMFTQRRCVKITLPVFSTSFKVEIKNILGEFELKEESFEHEAEFQLNQSGVNVPHVAFEDTLSETVESPEQETCRIENEKPIQFLANRPFLFILTKSNHIMYMGWYQ